MNLTDYNIPLICFVSFLLVVWFESDIIQTISKLTGTRSWFRIPEFEKYKIETDAMASYSNFLYEVYPGYITKLLSCPICLCFWSTLISTNTLIYSINYPQLFVVFLFPVNYICSLLLYLLIKKLL